jgi:fucose 4-O-acetylase-like acetyltransferase
MSKRIGYIDAMRGFTMILVVYSHVCNFCLGDRNMAFNDVLFLFRLPCFFFISGWLFQGTWGRVTQGTVPRVNSVADNTGTVPHVTVWSIIKHKFMVQIVPTLIFLFFLSPPPAYFHQFGAFKGGYWFTFALFYFFVIYMLMSWSFRHRQGRRSDIIMLLLTLAISMSAYWYDINYHRLQLSFAMPHSQRENFHLSIFTFQLVADTLGLLSFVVWRYYLFFFLGTLARKYFPQFLKLTSNGKIMALIVICFLVISQIPQSDIFLREYFKFSIGGILGMTMIFALFRYLYTSSLSSFSHYTSAIIHPTSAFLKFVGTRTLDIYLLHYFFLPEFLLPHATPLLATIPSILLPLIILLAALVVVFLCLATSYLLRLSPFLGRYLFGAK